MVVCLSDVNTILSFHALLRLLGDRGPPLSAQFLWLASVRRKHGGRLDRSRRGEVIFLPMFDAVALQTVTATEEICWLPVHQTKCFQQRELKRVFRHHHPRRQPLWWLGLPRAPSTSKLPPEQPCCFQGCPQKLGRLGETLWTPHLILQPGGQRLPRATSHILIPPATLWSVSCISFPPTEELNMASSQDRLTEQGSFSRFVDSGNSRFKKLCFCF